MRMVFLTLLIVGLLYYCLYQPFIRKESFNWFMAAVLAIICVPTGIMEARWQVLEHEAGEVVAEISENPNGTLRCQRFSAAFLDPEVTKGGHVKWDKPDVAVVNYKQCKQLFAWMTSDKKTATLPQIQAIHVLTHEAVHVSGEKSEPVTECTAVNRNFTTASKLGAKQEQATIIATTYYSQMWQHMPASYRLEGCTMAPEFDSITVKKMAKTDQTTG